MKSVVIGARGAPRAGREAPASVEAALVPALADGNWTVPGRFNFTRDVVETLGRDPRRQALTFLGSDGVIEPRTFFQLAQGAARWAGLLREHHVGPGDRVLVLEGVSPDWVEIMLAGIKVGAVTVPCARTLPAAALDIRIAASGARLVVAARSEEAELARTAQSCPVVYVDDVRRLASRLPKTAPTHDTSVRDPAFIVSTSGRTNGPRGVVHMHSSTFAARAHTQHWLDAGLGDIVWCTAPADSAQSLWSTLLGPWSRGAEIVIHEGSLDPVEQLEVVRRLGVTILCQTPAEYRALAETQQLERYRWARPRRLVSTGECLSEDLIGIFEGEWGLTIHDGYGQTETGIIAGHDVASGFRAGSVGRPLPGYEVTVIDEHGDELPPGSEGDLALRGRPPSLFSAYWSAPSETHAAFRGDWYLTGDVGARDEDGFLWFVRRAGDVVGTSGARSGTLEVEQGPSEDVVPVNRASAPVAQVVEPPAPVVVEPASERYHQVVTVPPAALDWPAQPTTLPEEEEPTHGAPLWARVTASIWVLLAGVLIGGAAIPHAQDEPRVVPRSEDQPNAICLPRASGR